MLMTAVIVSAGCTKPDDPNNGGNNNGGNNNGGNGGNSLNGHEYVDLGLPSGLLWASCNVGARAPEDCGDYFAWGETQSEDYYDWTTYQHCYGSSTSFTKYCTKASMGYCGLIDNLTVLLPVDDAATANWGANWRTPTKEEWEELYFSTTNTWTVLNGVCGRLFTASNGNSLFLPAAGHRLEGNLWVLGEGGYYWSSSLNSSYPNNAISFYFSDRYYMTINYRYSGFSVRPVCFVSQRQNLDF